MMASCPQCGKPISEQGATAGRCRACGTKLTGSKAEQPGREKHGTLPLPGDDDPAGAGGDSPTTESTATADSIRQKIQPRELSPEYQHRVVTAWQATCSAFRRADETIKCDMGAPERSFSLHIGTRQVKESTDDPNSDYELLEEIGEGAMGKVWSARQTALNRVVAIKYPKEALSESTASYSTQRRSHRDNFIDEVLVTGQLDHPNIVPIYDLAHDVNGQPFYSMKQVEGQSWDQCIREKSREENLEILMKACDAIRFAHEKGRVIHRDIKPQNIVVGAFGEVSVMDFGIALRLEDQTSRQSQHSLSPCGTPAYMPPEMAAANIAEMGPPSDVYLLGAVLYEIITGHPPHPSAESLNSVVLIAARNVIVPAKERSELVDIAYRAMATNIDDRYQTVQEFQDAIQNYRSHLESVKLTERGQDYLARAKDTGPGSSPEQARFDEYDRARFAFEAALDLWPENARARRGSEKTILAYADYAYQQKAYAQGIALLDPQREAHQPQLSKLKKALQEQEAAEQHRRRLRAIIGGLVVTFLICALGAAFVLNRLRVEAVAARADAENARDEAVEARKAEEDAKKDAIARRKDAEKARDEATVAKNKAVEAKQQADAARIAEEAAKKVAVVRRREAEQSSYISEIGLAAEEVQRNAFDTVRAILDQKSALKSKLRHWEWAHLAYLATQAPIEQFPTDKTQPVESVAISSDQRWVVAGTAGGEIHLWQRGAMGQPSLHLAEIHGTRISAVAISHDGQYAASAGTNPRGRDSVKIWRLSSARERIDISRTGEIFMPHPGRLLSLAFSRDNDHRRLLTSSAAGWVQVWALDSPEQPLLTLPKNDRAVWSARFSPDEQRIVTAGQDGTVRVWCTHNAARGEEQRWVGHQGPVYTAEFAPDGNTIVSGGRDGRLLVWQVPGDSCAGTFRQTRPEEVKQHLKNEQVELLAEGHVAQRHEHTASIRSLSFAGVDAAGKPTYLFSAGHDNTIRVWDVSRGVENLQFTKTLRGHGGWVRSCAATLGGTEGSRILSGGYDGRIRLWDWKKYDFATVLRDDPRGALGDLRLTSADYSADGKWIATASENGIVTVWGDMRRPEPKPQHLREGHQWLTTTGQLFDDGKRLVTAGGDNTARIWDAELGIQVQRLGGPIEQNPGGGTGVRGIVAVSNHGRWIATGSDRLPETDATLAKLWNADTGQLVLRLETPDSGQRTQGEPPEATALAFSPDDSLLFVGDQYGNCHLFDTRSGTRQMSCQRNGKISAAVFLPAGGASLLTASLDGTVAKWNIVADGSNPQPVFELTHGDAVLAMAVSPDGKHAITATGRQDRQAVLRRWDLSTGEEVAEGSYRSVPLQKIAKIHGVEDSAPATSKDPDLRPVIRAVAFHPQGRSALVTVFEPKTSKYHLGRWTWADQETYQELKISTSPLHDVSMALDTPDGAILTVGGTGARKWSLAGRNQLEQSFGTASGINSVCFSPDSQLLVAAAADGSATIWQFDAQAGTWKSAQKLMGQHRRALHSAVFHPQRSDLLLTAGGDGVARLWRMQAGVWQPILALDGPEGHAGPIYQANFSPGGDKILTVSADNTARIWEYDVRTGEKSLVGNPLEHDGSQVRCGVFSPDGRRVITGAGDEAWIWNAVTCAPYQPGSRRNKLAGHSADVTSLAFSADGTRVLTGSRDFTVKLWDTRGLLDAPFDANNGPDEDQPGQDHFRVLLTLEEHTRQVTSVAFSPHGREVLTTGLDGQAILWPAVALPPSISFSETTIDYALGQDDKKLLADRAVLNEPTPTDFTSATVSIELDDAHASISSDLVDSASPPLPAGWTMETERRADGVRVYRFIPGQQFPVGRAEFQALLRSIAYTHRQPDAEAADRDDATGAPPSPVAECTVRLELSGLRTLPDADGNTQEIEPIREQVAIRLIFQSSETPPASSGEEQGPEL